MVTQRPLEALFLVRVQAGQPRRRPSNSNVVNIMRRKTEFSDLRANRHKRINGPSIRQLFGNALMPFSVRFEDNSDPVHNIGDVKNAHHPIVY